MLRLGLMVFTLCVVPAFAARAQNTPPDTEESRYVFNRVQDGFVRLDTKTGQVSLCSRRTVWTCDVVADERVALDNEIARLQAENAMLKKELLARGLDLPGGVKPPPPEARGGDQEFKLPSNAEFERMMAFLEKTWRRLVEMMNNFQRDILKKG
jgi:hypothetical protein